MNIGKRGAHEAQVCHQIMSQDPNWKRDPYEVSGGPAFLSTLGIKPVSDGETEQGRGSTAWDLYRARDIGGVSVLDAVQVKTGKIKGTSVPSEVMLATGNSVTPAIIRAILDTGCRWDLLFIAGDPKQEFVKVLMMDIGERIREVQNSIRVRDSQGDAAPFFVKLSDTRISGASRDDIRAFERFGVPLPAGKSWSKRAHFDFPHAEDPFTYKNETIPGRVWETPYKVRYAQLCVSLYRLGIRQNDWATVHRSEIPGIVASYDFGYGL
jgi:hypothetical protein